MTDRVDVPATRGSNLLANFSYSEMLTFAGEMMRTGFFPFAIDTPSKALAIILTGGELGMGPMESLRTLHIIKGKVGLPAEYMLARFLERGGKHEWVEYTAQQVELKLERHGKTHRERFSMKDAKDAGYIERSRNKQGETMYEKEPLAMLRSRAITRAVRAFAPDVTRKLYSPEEITEMDESEKRSAQKQAEPEPEPEVHEAEIVNKETGEVIEQPKMMAELEAEVLQRQMKRRLGFAADKIATMKRWSKVEKQNYVKAATKDLLGKDAPSTPEELERLTLWMEEEGKNLAPVQDEIPF